jgi:hypothetical protein
LFCCFYNSCRTASETETQTETETAVRNRNRKKRDAQLCFKETHLELLLTAILTAAVAAVLTAAKAAVVIYSEQKNTAARTNFAAVLTQQNCVIVCN